MYTPQSKIRAKLGMVSLMLDAMTNGKMSMSYRGKDPKHKQHTIPKKVWLRKKAAIKIQTVSRKINR